MGIDWWENIRRFKKSNEDEKNEDSLGPDIALSNRFIRKMLAFVGASKNDVFCDLGCGLGHVLVIAIQYGVKQAIGIEKDLDRSRKAKEYIASLNLSDRIDIRKGDFSSKKINLTEATIVYSGLTEDNGDLTLYTKKLRDGSKLVTLALPLLGVMPDGRDFPFYLMKKPFTRTHDVSEWIFKVLGRRASSEEFFAELDYDPYFDVDIPELKRIMKKRFAEL